MIEEIFKGNVRENRNIEVSADPTLTPKDIITLNQAESSKFSYIIGWVKIKLYRGVWGGQLICCITIKTVTPEFIPIIFFE